MNEYALVIDNVFKQIRTLESKPENIPHKNIEWFEVVREYGETPFTGVENGVWVIREIDPSTVQVVPNSVTPRQVRLILLQKGLLANVEAMIAQQNEETQITWQYATEFRRNDPLLINLSTNLGLTDEQVDQFFIEASQL